jgi:hypothetical protein
MAKKTSIGKVEVTEKHRMATEIRNHQLSFGDELEIRKKVLTMWERYC